jgi:predicted DNA-binding ribbon-helix-helix protein
MTVSLQLTPSASLEEEDFRRLLQIAADRKITIEQVLYEAAHEKADRIREAQQSGEKKTP